MAITPATAWGRITRIPRTLLGELLPWNCGVCGIEADSAFCDRCRADLKESPRRCPRCAVPIGRYEQATLPAGCNRCLSQRFGFESAVALGCYEGNLRELCLRMKRRTDSWLGLRLAELWIEARRDQLPVDPVEQVVVVPVPLHWSRLLRRGYNQSESLAQGLCQALRRPLRRALRRVRATPKLAGRSRSERARLIQDAFRVNFFSRRAIAGRTVLLVDDVLTTGATCSAAAQALKRAGARRVVVAVIARA